MTRILNSTLNHAMKLSFWRFFLLFLTIAVTGANVIGTVVWYVLFRAYGADVLVPVTITANLVAIPILAFLAYVIQELRRSNDDLSGTKENLDVHVEHLERMRETERKQRTELKRTLSELSIARDVSDTANRAKSEFLANMSHELRTPLNAINGFSEIMCKQMFGPLGDARYIEYARDINESGSHLLGLINDILDLSKIEAGMFELKEEAVDVAQVVSACRRIIRERAKEAGLTLATRLKGGLPRLWSDKRAVKQIVLNLLSNAVKFTPAGGKVTLQVEIDEDGCFSLIVSDTGIGISADDIPKVFTPFSQVDSSLSREHDGTGLGLPLTNSLVELHGGMIELESELGNGTIVTVRLPAERVLDNPAKTGGNGVKASAAR